MQCQTRGLLIADSGIRTYLCSVVEREGALALNVIVSPIFELVVLADKNLYVTLSRVSNTSSFHLYPLTSFPLPGSLAVANCSSLYLSNAELTDCKSLGSSIVRALISAFHVLISFYALRLCSSAVVYQL